jgi:hypothetical protein
MRELAHGVARVIDDIERLNFLQRAAYEKCDTGFDWSDRGRTLCNAFRQAVSRKWNCSCDDVGTMSGPNANIVAAPMVR